MTTPDWTAFDDAFAHDVAPVDATAGGLYGREIAALLELSARAALPDVAQDACADLIALVRQAAQANLARADLIEQINALGGAAASIASRAAGLGTR